MKFQVTKNCWFGSKWTVCELPETTKERMGTVLSLDLSGNIVAFVEIHPDDYMSGNIDTYTAAALIDGMHMIHKNVMWRRDFGQI